MTNRQHDIRWWWFIAIGAAIGFAVVFLLTAAASAQTGVEIPLDQIYRGVSGEIIVIAEIDAADTQLGSMCDAFLDRFNNDSIHAKDGHPEHGTNLIITSGTNGTRFNNIESPSFEEARRNFVLDGDIIVSIQIGEDKVASMGFNLSFECNPPPDQTTTTSTTLAPPEGSTTTTTPSTTTTTEPPPVDGPNTGGGACEPRTVCEDTMS